MECRRRTGSGWGCVGRRAFARVGIGWAMIWGVVAASSAEVDREESKVPAYRLPGVLRMEDGRRVGTATEWREGRRPEVLELFAREVYGHPPRPPLNPRWEVLREVAEEVPGVGRRVRQDVALEVSGVKGARERVLRFTVFRPGDGEHPVPVFAGLHLFDTAKDHPEPAVARRVSGGGDGGNGAGARAVGRELGVRILGRGYALVSVDLPELAPDSAADWWRGSMRVTGRAGSGPPAPGETGAIGVWAWGLSRVIDFAATTRDLDARRVVAIGHSRMGKAALWAGAVDERFAAVISNDSGCGGAALSKRIYGETVGIISRAFPHWFTGGFGRYADREGDLPVDQHQLLALVAPRPLMVGSATEDAWADPLGEFLSVWHAAPVYRLLGVSGWEGVPDRLPSAEQPVGDVLRYHLRRGRHDLTDVDWERYLEFADRHLRGVRPTGEPGGR